MTLEKGWPTKKAINSIDTKRKSARHKLSIGTTMKHDVHAVPFDLHKAVPESVVTAIMARLRK